MAKKKGEGGSDGAVRETPRLHREHWCLPLVQGVMCIMMLDIRCDGNGAWLDYGDCMNACMHSAIACSTRQGTGMIPEGIL